MSAVINVAVPVFAIMLAGYLAGRFRILGESSSEALNAFVYWFALPPVLFLSMASVPIGEIFNWPFIWTFTERDGARCDPVGHPRPFHISQ